jgi:hypothetical protein
MPSPSTNWSINVSVMGSSVAVDVADPDVPPVDTMLPPEAAVSLHPTQLRAMAAAKANASNFLRIMFSSLNDYLWRPAFTPGVF